MTKSELLKEIQSLQLRVAACDKDLNKMLGKPYCSFPGQEYKRISDNKYRYLTQVAILRQQLKSM